jgi:hypothetical protein
VPSRDLVSQKMWDTNAALTEEAWGRMRDLAVRDGVREGEVEIVRSDRGVRIVDVVMQPLWPGGEFGRR